MEKIVLFLTFFIIFVFNATAQNRSVHICDGGVVNGKAAFFPMPEYPKKAKANGLTGTVNIYVTIDEKGNVIKAKICSGNPVFIKESLKAAKKSKFKPTHLSGQPVKVAGVIVYNFNL